MSGMNAATGKPISGDARLAQSVADVLRTPIGTRVMRRDYGSLLPELIDSPQNPATRLAMTAATAVAIGRHVRRLTVSRVDVRFEPSATVAIDIEGSRADAPGPNSFTRLTIPLRLAPAN